MPYSHKSVANTIIQKMRGTGENISPLKLQKLLFHTCGYYIAANGGNPLIDHTFEAWDYGPVVPDLYRHFRHYGNGPITGPAFDHDANSGAMVPVSPPSGDVLLDQEVDFVTETYGKFSAIQLSEMTHSAGSPWDVARKENQGIRDADIDRSKMLNHFSQFVGQL